MIGLGSDKECNTVGKWRFRKSLRIAPGVRLNLGSKSWGVSVGPRGARFGVNSLRGAYTYLSIRGTGLYQRTNLSSETRPSTEGSSTRYESQRSARFGRVVLLIVAIIIAATFLTKGPIKVAALFGLMAALLWCVALMLTSLKAALQSTEIDSPIRSSAANESTTHGPIDLPVKTHNVIQGDAKPFVDSVFLNEHFEDFSLCLDSDGDIQILEDSPSWIVDLYREALKPRRADEESRWSGRLVSAPQVDTGGAPLLDALTPLTLTLAHFREAREHYDPVSLEVLEMRRTLFSFAFVGGFASEVTGIIDAAILSPDRKPIKSFNSALFLEKHDPGCYHAYAIGIEFGFRAVENIIRAPFHVAVITQFGEFRYAFDHGVR
jgi:hypothetical protein